DPRGRRQGAHGGPLARAAPRARARSARCGRAQSLGAGLGERGSRRVVRGAHLGPARPGVRTARRARGARPPGRALLARSARRAEFRRAGARRRAHRLSPVVRADRLPRAPRGRAQAGELPRGVDPEPQPRPRAASRVSPRLRVARGEFRGRPRLTRRGLALAAALGAFACGRGDTFDAGGVVREVRAEERQVTIEHGDIPGLMPAMTMSFDVADPALLAGLAPGQYVEFRIARRGERFEIVSLGAPEGAGEAGASEASRGDSLAAAGDPAPDFALIDQDAHPI